MGCCKKFIAAARIFHLSSAIHGGTIVMYGYVRICTDGYGANKRQDLLRNYPYSSVLIRINSLPVQEIRAKEVSHSLPTLWKYFHVVLSSPFT